MFWYKAVKQLKNKKSNLSCNKTLAFNIKLLNQGLWRVGEKILRVGKGQKNIV